MRPFSSEHSSASYLHLVLCWGDREERHRGGRSETDTSSALPSTCCPASTHTCRMGRHAAPVTSSKHDGPQAVWGKRPEFRPEPAGHQARLPLLWGRHQSGELIVVEPQHGEVVERKFCTEREAQVRMMMTSDEAALYTCLPPPHHAHSRRPYASFTSS